MKVNIYYGGRGLIDDPTIYAMNKVGTVLEELNIQVKRYNLYEDKRGISVLPKTLKEAGKLDEPKDNETREIRIVSSINELKEKKQYIRIFGTIIQIEIDTILNIGLIFVTTIFLFDQCHINLHSNMLLMLFRLAKRMLVKIFTHPNHLNILNKGSIHI